MWLAKPARSAFRRARSSTAASRSQPKTAARGAWPGLPRAASAACISFQRAGTNPGQRSKANARPDPGGRPAAIAAASMAKVPAPHMASMSGRSRVVPRQRQHTGGQRLAQGRPPRLLPPPPPVQQLPRRVHAHRPHIIFPPHQHPRRDFAPRPGASSSPPARPRSAPAPLLSRAVGGSARACWPQAVADGQGDGLGDGLGVVEARAGGAHGQPQGAIGRARRGRSRACRAGGAASENSRARTVPTPHQHPGRHPQPQVRRQPHRQRAGKLDAARHRARPRARRAAARPPPGPPPPAPAPPPRTSAARRTSPPRPGDLDGAPSHAGRPLLAAQGSRRHPRRSACGPAPRGLPVPPPHPRLPSHARAPRQPASPSRPRAPGSWRGGRRSAGAPAAPPCRCGRPPASRGVRPPRSRAPRPSCGRPPGHGPAPRGRGQLGAAGGAAARTAA